MRTRIPRWDEGTDLMSGPWWMLLDNDPVPLVCCPRGHKANLRDHTIEPDGEVNASILCGEPECGWHVWGTLEDWSVNHD